MASQLNIRVRFAPSPTGELHLGSARTALYNYLFARQHGGTLLLRVEDTDQKRFVAGSMDRFIDDLRWLGIEFDSEPIIQSSRFGRHREVAAELVKHGAAYFEPAADDDHGRKHANEEYRDGRTVYRGENRDLREVPAGRHVIRLKVPDGSIAFIDAVRGEIVVDWATVDDAVLLKSDGTPTYHLAAMVDDHDMEITHVFRGEEWLPSAPKHLLIYQAMGWPSPVFIHLPMILAKNHKKLSKRIHGEAVWVATYRREGYLPEAMINYLAFLGWNPGDNLPAGQAGREFLSREELIKEFSLERIHKAGAIFDPEKLRFMNAHYLRQLYDEAIVKKLRDGKFLTEALAKLPDDELSRWVRIHRERMTTLGELVTLVEPIMTLGDYPTERLIFRKSDRKRTHQGLNTTYALLNTAPAQIWESVERLQKALARAVADGLTNGDVFWPVRVALSGQEASAAPAELLWALGKEESLRRLEKAKEKLA